MESERVIIVQRRLKITERTCAMCGKTYPGWGVQRFCMPVCQRRWDYHQHAEKRRATRRAYYQRKKGAEVERRSTGWASELSRDLRSKRP